MGQLFETRTVEEQHAYAKANFCLKTGIAPSEYDNLSLREIRIFIEVANEMAKESQRK